MRRLGSLLLIVLVLVTVYCIGYRAGEKGESVLAGASAQQASTKAEDRDVYYPGTEDLAPDEMRVVACGTGMPSVRPKQAASCWLVELGNGDKFLFDIGSGSHERISAQKIPYDEINKI